jgi:histone H3/H4
MIHQATIQRIIREYRAEGMNQEGVEERAKIRYAELVEGYIPSGF